MERWRGCRKKFKNRGSWQEGREFVLPERRDDEMGGALEGVALAHGFYTGDEDGIFPGFEVGGERTTEGVFCAAVEQE